MKLEESLAERKEDLASKWYDLVLGTYPPETQKVWKSQLDQFKNPVGVTFRDALSQLFGLLLAWDDAEAISHQLERIIKIRNVQDFTPSHGMSFVYLLKRLLRDEYMDKLNKSGDLDQLLAFEARIDNLALMTFDIYVKCREIIYNLRVNEVKAAQHKLLVRARMIVDDLAEGAE